MLQCYTGISSFNCHLLAVIDQNGLKEKWETIRKMKNCLWLPQEDNVEVEILGHVWLRVTSKFHKKTNARK